MLQRASASSPAFSAGRVWRLVWASPNSLVGLGLGAVWLLAGAQARRVDGVLEVALKPSRRAQPKRRKLPFVAIALGHVVIAANSEDLDRLRAHEHVHVRQSERWGPLFLPAYLAAGAWQWARGRRAYWDNPFEEEARRWSGEE